MTKKVEIEFCTDKSSGQVVFRRSTVTFAENSCITDTTSENPKEHLPTSASKSIFRIGYALARFESDGISDLSAPDPCWPLKESLKKCIKNKRDGAVKKVLGGVAGIEHLFDLKHGFRIRTQNIGPSDVSVRLLNAKNERMDSAACLKNLLESIKSRAIPMAAAANTPDALEPNPIWRKVLDSTSKKKLNTATLTEIDKLVIGKSFWVAELLELQSLLKTIPRTLRALQEEFVVMRDAVERAQTYAELFNTQEDLFKRVGFFRGPFIGIQRENLAEYGTLFDAVGEQFEFHAAWCSLVKRFFEIAIEGNWPPEKQEQDKFAAIVRECELMLRDQEELGTVADACRMRMLEYMGAARSVNPI